MMTDNISGAAFFEWPATKQLLSAFKQADIDARFVGGCVRDALLGREVKDVDLASPTPPEEALHALQALDLHVIPTGIEHGTITIVVDGTSFELTTLRRDVDCDGRHAIVAYTDDWESDAKRRDFTINGLYASPSGVVYDYIGGRADLNAKRLQFIGDAQARIKEDGLRILRLFRFQAQLGFSVDPALYELSKKRSRYLGNISYERVRQELLRLLEATQPEPAWQALFDYGIANKLFGALLSNRLDVVCLAEQRLKTGSLLPIQRLALLAWLVPESHADELKAKLVLSNDHTKLIQRTLTYTPHIKADTSINEQRKWHYLLGGELYRLCVVAAAASVLEGHKDRSVEAFARMMSDASQWDPPTFPLSGADLIALGYEPGEAMGELLRKLEDGWIESGFALSKEELMKQAASMQTADPALPSG